MQIRFGADKALRVLWQQFIGSFLFPLWWSITDSCNICHTKLSKRHNLKEHIKERTKVRLQIITSLQQTHDLKDRCDKPNSRNIFFFFYIITWSLFVASTEAVFNLFTIDARLDISPWSSSSKFWSETSADKPKCIRKNIKEILRMTVRINIIHQTTCKKGISTAITNAWVLNYLDVQINKWYFWTILTESFSVTLKTS